MMRECLAALLVVFVCGFPINARAAACSAADFACPATGVCVISGQVAVGSDCMLDFGSRDVELRGRLQADAEGGSFSVRANEFVLNGGELRSIGTSAIPGGSVDVVLTGEFRMQGAGPRCDTSAIAGGGTIAVSASTIQLSTGVITAEGGSGDSCGEGGFVSLRASSGPVAANNVIRVGTPGHDCEGGEIELTGASVQVGGELDAHGGARASESALSIEATNGDVTIGSAASLNTDGTGQDGFIGADGGDVSIEATAGSITMGAPLSSKGKAPSGGGGNLFLSARDAVVVSGAIVLSGGGRGAGGQLQLESQGTANVSGTISAAGGASVTDGRGGDIQIRAAGAVTVTSALSAVGVSGGDITLEGSPLLFSGSAIVRGSRTLGGSVQVFGCRTDVTGSVDAGAANGGTAGRVAVRSGVASIGPGAQVLALPCAGQDCISITTNGGSASISGQASVTPTAIQAADSTLPIC